MPKDVIDRDMGFDAVQQAFKDFDDAVITIGFQGKSGLESPDGESTIVDIATWNHFGTPDAALPIPPRPFLSQAMDDNARDINHRIEAEAARVIAGRQKPKRALLRIAEFIKAKVQRKITDSKSWATPNAPATIDRKGSDVPLIDSGRMRQSVTYVVKINGVAVAEG